MSSIFAWNVIILVIVGVVVFVAIAALVIFLVAKNGRRSTQSRSLGGYHAEWTFPRGGAPAEPQIQQQDPAALTQPQDPAQPNGPTGASPAA